MFTYGSPPIFVIQDDPDAVAKGVSSSTAASGTSSADSCSILEALNLPIGEFQNTTDKCISNASI